MNTLYLNARMSANGARVIHSRAAVLRRVTINQKGGSANLLTIYNNSAGSGDIVAVIDTTAGVATLWYDIYCPQGITAVMATGTAGEVSIQTEGPEV